MSSLQSALFSGAVALSLMSLGSAQIIWTSCGTDLDCGTIQVPLEYAGPSTSVSNASIALVRYNSTVVPEEHRGSLLVNPGGPGASGVSLVAAGAGQAISVLSGGYYDIIGWDPRGTGQSTPLLECFSNAGAEYTFANSFPGSPNLWLGAFSNSSYDEQILSAVTGFDSAVAELSQACIDQDSDALLTSSVAYVARDMAAIVDAVDGTDALLNYWGFSYGTVFLVEFIQAFPHRVGRVLADGVFDAQANAETHVSQLANDQISVRGFLNYFEDLCTSAGEGCSLSTAPAGITSSLATRLDNVFQDLFENPIDYEGLSISLDIFNSFLWSLSRVPTTWQLLAEVITGLEVRNAIALVNVLTQTAYTVPSNSSAPGTGTLVTWPLQCVDNAPSSAITLDQIVSLTKNISITEDTPLLSADLTALSFCRNFSDARPALANAGVSLMSETNALLSASNVTVLIVNAELDPVTPLKSAKHLREMLADSSILAVREGSGHTSISQASAGLAEVIYNFFVSGEIPAVDAEVHAVDQDVFPSGLNEVSFATPLTLTGSNYTSLQSSLLEATYDIGLAFLAIA